MENLINNRIYMLVNKRDIYNAKRYYKYGWASNPYDVLNYMDEQKALTPDKRYMKPGEYVVLYHDRDTGTYGYASFGNDPSWKQRVFTMKREA